MAGTSETQRKRLRRDARARARDEAAAERRTKRVVHLGDGLFISDADCRYLSATGDHDGPAEDGTDQPAPKRLHRHARARARDEAAAEGRTRRVVHLGDGLFISNADCRYLSATGDHDGPAEDGTDQPAPKRLRRHARARARDEAAAEGRTRRVVHLGDGLFISDADCRYLSATGDHDGPAEDGTDQPAPKRLRRHARARARDEAAAEGRTRRVVHLGDDLFISDGPFVGDAEGCLVPETVDENEPPEAEARLGGQPQLRRIWTIWGTEYGVIGWIVLRRVEGVGEGMLGAAADIFLVQPRENGVPPSTLQTIREAGFSYWIDELRFWIAARRGRVELPGSWSWEGVMGQPAYGGRGMCAICAIATCIRARHCIQFERRYGAGTFPYVLEDVHYLRDACEAAGLWDPISGAMTSQVLELMRGQDMWVRTQDVEGWQSCQLRFNRFGLFPKVDSDSARDSIALRIRRHGPIIGALYAGPDYELSDHDPEYVYRGDDDDAGEGEPEPPDHAVVVMAYRFTAAGELHLRVLDNVTAHGPLRWILYEAFGYFFYIAVDPLDRAELLQRNNNDGVAQRLISLFWRS